MTELLASAFAEVAKLSTSEQDAFAAWILEEVAAEKKWDELFAKSQDKLAALGSAALAEHRQGKTWRLG